MRSPFLQRARPKTRSVVCYNDDTSKRRDGPVIVYSLFQDQDEATQGADSTLQEFYYQSEKKSIRSEGSEEEAEGHEERLPLSISTCVASFLLWLFLIRETEQH